MNNPVVEVIRRVYTCDKDAELYAHLQVQANPEYPSSSILISTGDNNASNNYYGAVHLVLFDKDAKALAEQILKCYEEKEKMP